MWWCLPSNIFAAIRNTILVLQCRYMTSAPANHKKVRSHDWRSDMLSRKAQVSAAFGSMLTWQLHIRAEGAADALAAVTPVAPGTHIVVTCTADTKKLKQASNSGDICCGTRDAWLLDHEAMLFAQDDAAIAWEIMQTGHLYAWQACNSSTTLTTSTLAMVQTCH